MAVRSHNGRLRRSGTAGRDLGAAVAVSVAASLAVFLVGALAVQLRQSLHFGPAALGVAVSLYYVGAAVGSVPFARLSEAIGGGRVMRLASLAAGLLLGLLAVVLHSWGELCVLLLAAGLVSSSMAPATNLFLARRADPSHQGAAFGLKQAAIPASALLGGLAVPALALTVGWRWAFASGAVLAGAAAASVPRSHSTLAQHRARAVAADRGPLLPLVVLAIGFGFGVFAASGLSAFAATSAVEAGASHADAGLLVALGGAVAVGARIVSGILADRRGGRHLPVVAGMLVAGGGGYALLALAVAARSELLFAIGLAAAFGAGWGWNGLFNFAIIRTHPLAPARATAITQVGGRLAGAVGPLSFGLIVAHGSYSTAWGLDGAMLVAAAAVILFGRRLLGATQPALPADPAAAPSGG